MDFRKNDSGLGVNGLQGGFAGLGVSVYQLYQISVRKFGVKPTPPEMTRTTIYIIYIIYYILYIIYYIYIY